MFEKSQNYGKDKAKFAFFSGLFKQALDSSMLHFGFYTWSWGASGALIGKFGFGSEYQVRRLFETEVSACLTISKILQSIGFVFILFFLSSIPTLPLSVYATFVLEEKHGFNKTTPKLFVTDLFKGWALAFGLGAPFIAAFLYIFQWAGDRFVPWLMAFMWVNPNTYQCRTIDALISGSRSSLSWSSSTPP